MTRARWSKNESEISLEQVSKIVILTLEGHSRNKVAEESNSSPFSVHKYRKIILES